MPQWKFMYAIMPILTFGDITQLGATITPSPSITDEDMTLEGDVLLLGTGNPNRGEFL